MGPGGWRRVWAWVLAIAVPFAVPGQAEVIITGFSGGTQLGQSCDDGGNTVGWKFTVGPTDLEAVALGEYDADGNGLAMDVQVGIWDASGTLLGMVTVPGGTMPPLIGSFRYQALPTPVVLQSLQTYTIGSRCTGENDTGVHAPLSNPSFTFSSDVSTAGGRYNNGGMSTTFGEPTMNLGGTIHLGPNLEYNLLNTATPTIPTPTATSTATATIPTPTATDTATATPEPDTPTATSTVTPTPEPDTPTATSTATATPEPDTPTATSTASPTIPAPTATPTETSTFDPETPTAASTATPTTVPDTPTATGTATETPTQLPNGASCQDGVQCRSTFCVDGVCCDSACTGGAVRCDLPPTPGVCTAIPQAAAPAMSPLGLLLGIAALLLVAATAANAARRRGAD